MKFIIDTCVVIDIIQRREPFFKDAFLFLQDMIFYKSQGMVLSSSVTDVHYILKKSMKNEERVRENLKYMYTLFTVVDTLSQDTYEAIFSDMKDYEDAVIVEVAKRLNADAIITRNINDYKESRVRILCPSEARNLW